MWPYPWTHVGTPSHLGHMDRVAASMPSQAHAGAAQEAPDIGQWEGQDVPLVRPSSCNVKGGIPSSRRYLPTWIDSTVTTPGRISFQLMDPVGSVHVGVMRRVWFPSRGSWWLYGTWWLVRGFDMCCTLVVGFASFWGRQVMFPQQGVVSGWGCGPWWTGGYVRLWYWLWCCRSEVSDRMCPCSPILVEVYL